jgi:two-component system response regulator HupR/HoxA
MSALATFVVLPSRWVGPAAPSRDEASLVFPEGYIPGCAPAMLDLYRQIRAIARSEVPVLLMGETGVGKELLAQTLHASSARRDGPFVAVNCAAIPAELLEAELFGIGKGVATGVNERPGQFQLARGGTLFLDEIGDMPSALQAKVLRALQGREIQPVGGPPVRFDARVITATNTDLDAQIERGQFRRDLYYRVAGFVLRVPALRERREDIAGLVQALLAVHAREAGKSIPGVTAEAMRALAGYPWPGNVRELDHEMRRLVCLGREGHAAGPELLSERVLVCDGGEPEAAPSSLRIDAHIGHLERRLVRTALLRTGGKRSAAARLLGISRNGLAMKMERLGLTARDSDPASGVL